MLENGCPFSQPPTNPPAMNDTQLGRYHITRVLGQGSMGIVYEARDPHLDRSVAVKTTRTRDLPPDQAAAYERRFLTEARSAARLRHPSIVSVFDAGKDGAVTYLVMEFVDGVNLKHCLNNGVRFTPAGAVHLALSVLAGLEHAHEQRVIHRDVKPENVLLDMTGLAKLTDFGIAKLLESDMDNGTQLAGLSIGTPRYMSPEQVKGLPVDVRTDLYSVGVLLFELLTATTPFDGAHHMAVATQILHDPAPLPSSRASGVPPALDALVLKALAKRPEDRFQTADAFRNALHASLGSHGLQTDDAYVGGEPALALAQPDTAPILRWLFAQAKANHPAPDTPGSVVVLPDDASGTESNLLATSPTQLLMPSLSTASGLDGTRVAQREGFVTSPAALPVRPLVMSDTMSPTAVTVAAPGTSTQAVPLVPEQPQAINSVSEPVAGPVTAARAENQPAAHKKWVWWVMLAAVLLVSAGLWLGRSRAPQPVALPAEEFIEDTRNKAPDSATAAPRPTQPSETTAVPGGTAVQATDGTTAAAGVTPPVDETAAARARREARAKAKAKADAEAAAAAATQPSGPAESGSPAVAAPVVAPAVTRQDTPVAPAKAAPVRVEPCVGLTFFERESCLWKQCDTDAFRRHPACKRFNPDKADPIGR